MKYLCMGGPMDGHYEATEDTFKEGHIVNFLEPGVGQHEYELCAGILLYRGINEHTRKRA